MRYAEVELERQARELTYRIYVTDALQDIAFNTARYAGGNYPTVRFIDKIRHTETIRDDRTGDEIAEDILSRLYKLKDTENEGVDE